MKRYIKTLLLPALAGMLAASCDSWQVDLPVAVELGTTENEVDIPSSEGVYELPIFSLGKGNVSIVQGEDWLFPDRKTFRGDDTLYVQYMANPGFSRVGKLVMRTAEGERTDTLVFKQQGDQIPTFELPGSFVILNGAGPNEIPLNTNLDLSGVEMTITYPDDPEKADWIRSITYGDGVLVVDQIDNTSRILVKQATVSFVYTGEWGRKRRTLLYLTQANADNQLGSGVDFPYVRSLATEKGIVIQDDLYITGYVISDQTSGNVGENPLTDYKTVDYTGSLKTAYIESEDGLYGFMVQTRSEEDNIFQPNTKVQVLLSGVFLQKFSDPERYVLSRVAGDRVSSSEAVDPASVPCRELTLSQLTDQDIYTRVTIPDCELSVRKGGLSNINQNYSNAKYEKGIPHGYLSKCPTLAHDKSGQTIWIWTNTTCPYRQDGTKWGYGAGKVTGVLVHEKYRHFVDYDAANRADCGNIGRYQIRHMAKSDLAFSDSDDDANFGIVAEYRYLTAANEDRSWPPSDGECASAFTHSYLIPTTGTGAYKASGSEYYTNCRRPVTYTYLGPVGVTADCPWGLNVGNTNEFCHGIQLPDESWYGTADQTATNKIGDGKTDNASVAPTGWRQDFWWIDPDKVEDSGDEWMAEWLVWFSTKDLETTLLTMQWSAQNQPTATGAGPRYWKAEWSLTGDVSKDDDWTLLTEYVVPDHMMGSTTRDNLSGSFRTYDIILPSAMIGQEKVWVRFKPADYRCGSVSTYNELDIREAAKTANSCRCCMDYFAVKYLK